MTGGEGCWVQPWKVPSPAAPCAGEGAREPCLHWWLRDRLDDNLAEEFGTGMVQSWGRTLGLVASPGRAIHGVW